MLPQQRAAVAVLLSLAVISPPIGALAGSATHTYDFRKPSTLGESVRGPATITVTEVNPLRYLDAYLAETRTVQQNTSPGGLSALGSASPLLQTLASVLQGGGNKMSLITKNVVGTSAQPSAQCDALLSAYADYYKAMAVEENLQTDKAVVQEAIADFQPLFGPNGPTDPVTPAMQIATDKAPATAGAPSAGHIVSYIVDGNGGVVASDAVNAYDQNVQRALSGLNGIPSSAYNQQCAGESGGQVVRIGDAVDKLTPELKDRSSGGSRYEDVHTALDDLRDWATRLHAAGTSKDAYQVSRPIDCHDAHGFSSSTVAVTLNATDATKVQKNSDGSGDGSGSGGGSDDGATGQDKGDKNHGGDKKAGKGGHDSSTSKDPGSVAVDVVTVACYAPLTATNGATLANIPLQAFTVGHVAPVAAGAMLRGKHGQSTQTGTVQHSTDKSSQTSYNPAAISYRLPILQNNGGTDISLTAALSNAASGMAGLTLSFERSIFLTAALIRSDYSSLGGGFSLGQQVPLNTKLPVVKMPTTRFAIMLSFPTPANKLFSNSKKRDQGSGSDSKNGKSDGGDKGNDGN